MKSTDLTIQLLQSLKKNDKCKFHASGSSMLPLIRANDQLILQKVNINSIRKCDIIVFHSKEVERLLVHRVISIDSKNKKMLLTTKGDNNLLEDNILTNEKNFIGKIITIKNKEINLSKNKYCWLQLYFKSKVFLKIKNKLFQLLYNTCLRG